MADIVWLTKSKDLVRSIADSSLYDGSKGGTVYNYNAFSTLSVNYKLACPDKYSHIGNNSFIKYLYFVNNRDIQCRLAIYDPFLLSYKMRRIYDFELAVLHHVDFELLQPSNKYKIFFNMMLHKMKSLDCIVTVSQYWREYLQSRGIFNVYTIYNSFNREEYNVSDKDLYNFIHKYNLDKNKPIIYIGNANIEKGVIDVYNSLKNLNVQLIMTGPLSNRIDIPVHHYFLSKKEYICLLKASTLVITMSKMIEGWNRTAHESLLCRTPVIGSGTGGMKELLTKSGQIICEDYLQLQHLVTTLINDDNRLNNLADRGFDFAKNYDMNYFSNQFNSLIEEFI